MLSTATTLLMAHQSPAFVKEQLGHSSFQIAVDIYGHWFPGEGRNGLEEALTGPVRNQGENCISEKQKACNQLRLQTFSVLWCRRPESNRHERSSLRPQHSVSTSSTTSAILEFYLVVLFLSVIRWSYRETVPVRVLHKA